MSHREREDHSMALRSTIAAPKPVAYLPALIDRHVTVRSLREGLAAAGLRLEHDPTTGNLFILRR